jgi:exopolysaccharide production protein ExoZ
MVKLLNLQALRAIAAYSVVVHHVLNALNFYVAALDIPIMAFHAGVDVFFVISGFVMAASTAGRDISPGRFFRARLARVVPIYWLLTLLGSLGLLAGLRLFGWTHFSLTQFVGSLIFIPMFDANGAFIKPVLFVGWSLTFEMMFYGLFAISLLLKGERAQRLSLYGMLASILLANILIDHPVMNVLGLPYLLEFAAGVGIWQLVQRGMILSRRNAWIALAFAIAALIGSEFPTLPPAYRYDMACAIYCVPAAMIVLAFVSLERHGVVFNHPLVQLQGDASYSLYLTHIFVFQAVGKLTVATGLNQSWAGLVVSMAAAVIASGVAATLFHLQVERPLNRLARRLLATEREEPRAVPAPSLRA